MVQLALEWHITGADCVRRRFRAGRTLTKSRWASVMLPEAAHTQIQALVDANNGSAVMQFLDEHGDETLLPLKLSRTKKGERK